MPVTITRKQTRSVVPPTAPATDTAYRVLDECTASAGISPAIFVFDVATSSYSHVARAADMVLYGTDQAAARTRRDPFYRAASVTRDFVSVSDAQAFALDVNGRVQYLCNEFDNALAEFLGDGTPTVVVTRSLP